MAGPERQEAGSAATPEQAAEPAVVTSPRGDGPHPTRKHTYARRVLVEKPLTIGRAARYITTFTLLMTVIGGVVIHYADPRNFPNIGDGLWWSVQTVTTVGYGDHVPTDVVGRLFAALIMLVGIGFLTVITATITAAFIESTRKRMQGVELRTLDAKLDALGARLEKIEARLPE